MEFKENSHMCMCYCCHILIESQWNLKGVSYHEIFNEIKILIESQWNLKQQRMEDCISISVILIESQWNLKLPVAALKWILTSILIESQWNLKIEARFFLVDTLSYYSGSVVKTKSNIFIMNWYG